LPKIEDLDIHYASRAEPTIVIIVDAETRHPEDMRRSR